MILDLINTGQINDYYILAIPFATAWLLAIAYTALGVGTMYLANREQPTPKPIGWQGRDLAWKARR